LIEPVTASAWEIGAFARVEISAQSSASEALSPSTPE
jgi:hypothetical protein